jgi:hypothetical protein
MALNIANFTLVRGLIADAPDALVDMREVGNPKDCGSPRCIAGWACTAMPDYTPAAPSLAQARDFLGLTPQQANYLFLSHLGPQAIGKIDKPTTLAAIDSLIQGNALPTWPTRIEKELNW